MSEDILNNNKNKKRDNLWTKDVKEKDERKTVKVPPEVHKKLVALAFAKDVKIVQLLEDMANSYKSTLDDNQRIVYDAKVDRN
ncbi:hypothetical protein [Shouchella miscanthi]|uniref:Uncharacterized protein n=1 Tax=Shouchella miscanthi TaxID=2598861 RepID=A0ABU6NND9_9BACI|nr:hypothetical protein [Shouchella miscanthi]